MRLRVSLLIIFLLTVGLSLPLKIFAQATSASSNEGVNGQKVGPELAFFDPNGQKKVNDNILVPNGFTGTTQVLNSVHDYPYNPAPGTKAVVRVVMLHGSKITKDGCNDPNPVSTSIEEAQAFAVNLNSFSGFPQGTIVMFGNELNNLQKEYCYSAEKGNPAVAYEAGQDYARLLEAFAAKLDHGPGKKYILAPTSIDPNNPEYSGKQFVLGIKAAGGYDVVDTLAQSVFDVPPAPDLESDITQDMVDTIPTKNRNLATYLAIAKLAGKTVTHFNGWGSAPQLSLRGQLDFLLNTPLPPGVNSAATLIANNCNGQQGFATDSWFFFVRGKIYDVDGNQIDPDTCGVTKSAQKSIYVYPGIEDESPGKAQLQKASEYMLTCGPQLTFAGNIENADRINVASANFQPIPLDCSTAGSCLIPKVSGFAYVNHEQTTIPLYRFQNAVVPNNSSPQRRLDDWEGFFSAKYNGGSDPYTNFVANGTATNLSSAEANCQSTLDFLSAIQNLCNNETISSAAVNSSQSSKPAPQASGAPPLRCALDLTIPRIQQSYIDVLNAKPAGFTCQRNPASLSPQTLQQYQDYQGKLALIENTTPKAFKPAYIIHYVNQPEKDPTVFDKIENWLAPEGTTSDEKISNRVKVTKVYVPAGFSASSTDSPGLVDKTINTGFTGGFMTTMYSLTSQDTTKQIQDNIKAQAAEIFSKSSGGNMTNPDPFSDRFLSCPECDQDSFISTIVKRINAEGFRNAPGEENLDCSATDIAGEKAAERKQTINPDGTSDPVREISMPARATLKAQGSIGKKVAMRTYFLLPQEYKNVFEYEKVLASSLFAPGYPESLNFSVKKQDDSAGGGKPAYKYLQLSDTAPKFGRSGKTVHMSAPTQEGQTIGYELTSVPQTPGSTTPPTTRLGKAVKLIGSIVSEDTSTFDVNPLVPGGMLARSLWELVCHAVQPPTNADYAPYAGFEKILQQGSSACFREKGAPKCAPASTGASISRVGNGWMVTAPADANALITSIPSEYGQRSCDWAKGKGLAFALNANFGQDAHTPIGPFGFNGNITNAAPENNNTMSLVIDKSGEAHVYDWTGRSGANIDKRGKPDLSNASFIVTGVYYSNFLPPYDGVLFRTAIGLKGNSIIIRNLAATPEGVKTAMAQQGIDDGHFFMLDGDSVSQLCQANPDGSMTQIYPDPGDPNVILAKYPFAVAVSMGIKAAGTQGTSCPAGTVACKPQAEQISCDNFRPGAPHILDEWTASNSEAETMCSPSGSPSGSGQSATITSDVVALALRVSDATCMPAEALIGVMAKESGGFKDDSGTPFGGDPTEIYTRNGCDALDIHSRNSSGYRNLDCGPYQYTQENITGNDAGQSGQIAVYGDVIRPCLKAIGIDLPDADLDTRMLGVSMCTAAANMWRGTTFSKSRACDGRGRSLNELSYDEVRNGVLVFHGFPQDDDGAWINYRSFIDQYKYLVGKVRGELVSCQQ